LADGRRNRAAYVERERKKPNLKVCPHNVVYQWISCKHQAQVQVSSYQFKFWSLSFELILRCRAQSVSLWLPRRSDSAGYPLNPSPLLPPVTTDHPPRRLLALGAAANGKLGGVVGAVAGVTPAQRVEYDAAVGSDNKPEIARLLALGAAANGKLGGTTTRSALKVPGCKLTVTELTPTGGREGECILKASRDEKQKRFRINCAANGGVFG